MTDDTNETQAKEKWEALTPDPGSVLAYHMAAAVESLEARYDNPTTEADYYTELLEEVDEYEYEQRTYDTNDIKYLNHCLELYGESPELLAAIANLQG